MGNDRLENDMSKYTCIFPFGALLDDSRLELINEFACNAITFSAQTSEVQKRASDTSSEYQMCILDEGRIITFTVYCAEQTLSN